MRTANLHRVQKHITTAPWTHTYISQSLGVKGLVRGASSECTLPPLGFGPATFWSERPNPLSHTPAPDTSMAFTEVHTLVTCNRVRCRSASVISALFSRVQVRSAPSSSHIFGGTPALRQARHRKWPEYRRFLRRELTNSIVCRSGEWRRLAEPLLLIFLFDRCATGEPSQEGAIYKPENIHPSLITAPSARGHTEAGD